MQSLRRIRASAMAMVFAAVACGRTDLSIFGLAGSPRGTGGGAPDADGSGPLAGTSSGAGKANGGGGDQAASGSGGVESGGAAGALDCGGAWCGGAAGSSGAAGASEICASSEAPDDGWVSTWGGPAFVRAAGVFTSDNGLIVAGSFNGTADFDPGPGVEERTASQRDLYLSGLDAEGGLLWTHVMGGPDLWGGIEVAGAARASDRGIFLVTAFSGTLNLEVGTSGNELTGPNDSNYSVGLIKRHADGGLAWGRAFPTQSFYASPVVAAAPDGSVLVAGNFTGSPDFDPGPGSDVRDAGAGLLSFVEKLDADGQHLSVVTPWREDCFVGAITVAADGSPWVAGLCGWAESDNWAGMFVAKLDESGSPSLTIKWDVEVFASALTTDANGALYLAGETRDGDLDPGPGVQDYETNGIGRDALLLKLDQNGSFQWARTWGSVWNEISWDDDELNALTLDGCGSILLGGRAPASLDLDPGPADRTVTAGAYLSRFTTDGELIWARSWPSPQVGWDYTRVTSVTSPATDAIWLAGTFAGTVDFGLNGSSDPRTSAGAEDSFTMRLDASSSQGP